MIKTLKPASEEEIQNIEAYLMTAPKVFWNGIKKTMDYKPSISGYTTTFNCESQKYPYLECIKSMLQFCAEVCIVDGCSTDGTLDTLALMSYGTSSVLHDLTLLLKAAFKEKKEFFEFPDAITVSNEQPYVVTRDQKIKVKIIFRDWSDLHFAVFDGQQKAEARKMCTKEFCWQMDSDEIVHEADVEKILHLAEKMPKEAELIALPVIEYWGSLDKVRCDISPWKWRLSRNKHNITHGIPKELRRLDDNGALYAAQGTDGCDIIDSSSFERIPFINFYTSDIDNLRRMALLGNEDARLQYEGWFNQVVEALPGVFHYSWFDLERKIRLYRDYWTKHWNSLYGLSLDDSVETNMMFNKPWSEVTDEDIKELAKQLLSTGGHIWHRKWNGSITPHIKVKRSQPKVMQK